ncbi:MAG: 5-aminoimidazole-4-carboxamide ribonucleotide formyltransferase [Acutalibacteraceae bacterium]
MSNELMLKYGCNPNQKPSRIFMKDGSALPITVLNGKPGYINFLDAFNSWQLVKELKEATGLPAAASFKHVSPAGAAVAIPMSDTLKKIYFVDDLELSPIATAYARYSVQTECLPMVILLHCPIHAMHRQQLYLQEKFRRSHCSRIYTGSIGNFKNKVKATIMSFKSMKHISLLIEHKDVYGITFEKGRNEIKINEEMLQNIVSENKELPQEAKRDLLIALITLKYTQSNSVCYAKDGQAIGIGAGQQSRIHCTRLAGNKADIWFLRQHPKVMNLPFKADIRRPDRDNTIDVYISDDDMDVLADGTWELFFTEKPERLTREEKRAWLDQQTGVSLGSDAFFPFGDNIERAHRSGVSYIAEAGGSIRDDHVIDTCNKYGICLAFTGVRLFHH